MVDRSSRDKKKAQRRPGLDSEIGTGGEGESKDNETHLEDIVYRQ